MNNKDQQGGSPDQEPGAIASPHLNAWIAWGIAATDGRIFSDGISLQHTIPLPEPIDHSQTFDLVCKYMNSTAIAETSAPTVLMQQLDLILRLLQLWSNYLKHMSPEQLAQLSTAALTAYESFDANAISFNAECMNLIQTAYTYCLTYHQNLPESNPQKMVPSCSPPSSATTYRPSISSGASASPVSLRQSSSLFPFG